MNNGGNYASETARSSTGGEDDDRAFIQSRIGKSTGEKEPTPSSNQSAIQLPTCDGILNGPERATAACASCQFLEKNFFI